MPVMDGFDSCRLMRSEETTSRATILALTGLSSSEDKKLAFESGMDD